MPTLIIKKGPRARKFKKPLVLEVPETKDAAEQKVQTYIMKTFVSRMPGLIPFTFENASTMEVAKHLLFHRTGSQCTLHAYIYAVYRYCGWLKARPDQLVNDCKDQDEVPIPKAVVEAGRQLDDFIADLLSQNISRSTVGRYLTNVKTFYRINGVKLGIPYYSFPTWSTYDDRAPTREELQKMLEVADLRERVIISMLAVGGLRVGTLARLQYRHVKTDLEKQIVPTHVCVEPEITKGRYHDYYTFLNQEASERLRAYLDVRRRGDRKTPPEHIEDESPLIKCGNRKNIQPITTCNLHAIIHDLYFRAGVLTSNSKVTMDKLEPHRTMYELRPYSIRKFFRTQMASLGVERDYIEFMMGHKLSTYHDVKMKGVEYLRGIYLTAGLSIQPKISLSKIDALKEIMCSWGLNPEEFLKHRVLAQSQATTLEQNQPL